MCVCVCVCVLCYSELARQANLVMLRRTQAILTRHLPPLVNYCLFCAPTQTQVCKGMTGTHTHTHTHTHTSVNPCFQEQ